MNSKTGTTSRRSLQTGRSPLGLNRWRPQWLTLREDVAFRSKLTVLLAQAAELFPLGAGQTVIACSAIDLRLLDPDMNRGSARFELSVSREKQRELLKAMKPAKDS
jgi:hypothetical protein